MFWLGATVCLPDVWQCYARCEIESRRSMLGFSDASFVCTIVLCSMARSMDSIRGQRPCILILMVVPQISARTCGICCRCGVVRQTTAVSDWLFNAVCIILFSLCFIILRTCKYIMVRYYDWSIGLKQCFDWWNVPGWHVMLSTVTALYFRPAFFKGVL